MQYSTSLLSARPSAAAGVGQTNMANYSDDDDDDNDYRRTSREGGGLPPCVGQSNIFRGIVK